MGKVYEERSDIMNSLFCYGQAIQMLKGRKKETVIRACIEKYNQFQAKYGVINQLNRSNFISERITFAKAGKIKAEDKKKSEILLKTLNDCYKLIESIDNVYCQYLKILYSYYVNSKNIYLFLFRKSYRSKNACTIFR